jgi:hypothetical protein
MRGIYGPKGRDKRKKQARNVTHERNEKCLQNFDQKIPRKECLGDKGTGERIISK